MKPIGYKVVLWLAIMWFGAVTVLAQTVNVVVTQSASSSNAIIGANFTISVELTNAGSQTATGVFLTNTLPTGTTLISVQVSQGSYSSSNTNVICSFGTLPEGAAVSVNLNLLPTIGGWETNQAMVVADETNVAPMNGNSFMAIFVGIESQPNTNWQILIPSLALAYASNSGQLYISVPTSAGALANSVIPVDPNTGVFGPPVLPGSYPQGLAISSDSQFLYVGTYSNRIFQRLNLPMGISDLTFALDPLATNTTLKDMEVEPSDPHSLVVLRTPDDFNVQVAVYQDGLALTNTAPTHADSYAESLALADNLPMAFVQNDGVGGLSSYSVNSNGVGLLSTDMTLNPLLVPITIHWANGLLYTSLGRIIDPIAHVIVGQIPTITAASLVAFDKVANRLFYLTPNGSTNVIRAIDPLTGTMLGMVNVAGGAGTPQNLVRWGADGLAFTTTAGQLFVVRSSIVPSGANADLAIGCVGAPAVVGLNTNFSFTTTVTNLGPYVASNVIVFGQLPDTAQRVSAVASAGTPTISNGLVQCNFGTLAVGGTATLQVTLQTALGGVMVNVASVLSDEIDPDVTNNVSRCVLQAALNLGPNTIGQVAMNVSDIVYDSATGQLYASGNSGQITILDPLSGLTNGGWSLPSSAGILRLSGDNTLIYCSLNQGQDVGQLSTTTGQLNFDLPFGRPVSDVAPVPGASGTFVVGSANVVEAFDGITPRPVFTDDSAGARDLAFGATTNEFYALGHALTGGTRYRVFSLTSSGISEISYNQNVPSSLGNLTFANGVFYATTGEIIDPQTGNTLGKFAGPGKGSLVVPDIADNRVFFLNNSNNVWRLQAYEPTTLGLIGSVAISNVVGTPTRLVRTTNDGLAFCTTSNQLFLLRTSLVPQGAPADLEISQAAGATVAWTGSNFLFTATVTNAGPNIASNVVMFDSIPANTTDLSNLTSQGTTSMAGGLVTWNVGALAVGAVATMKLVLVTPFAGNVANAVYVTSSQQDPELSNNSSKCTVQVGFNLTSGASGVVKVSAANIVYDPVSGLLYAACTNVPGFYTNSIITIDPGTGLLGGPVLIAPQILDVAISDDGTHVYTLAYSGHQLLGLNLSNGVYETQVTIGTNNAGDSGTLLKEIPGHPNSVAVVVKDPSVLLGNPQVTIYDGSAQRSNTTAARLIEFYSSDHIMGYDPRLVPSQSYRISVGALGVTTETSAGYLIDGDMAAAGGLVYTTGGSVINPNTMSNILSFGVSGPVAPDSAVDRVGFLTGGGSTRTLRVFDQTAQNSWGSVNVSNVVGTVGRMIRCGIDRYAFFTSSNQIFIVRCPGIPSAPSGPASLAMANRPTPPTAAPLLKITAPSGYRYVLESSTNLFNWNVVANYNATNTLMIIYDTNSTLQDACFYRVVNQ